MKTPTLSAVFAVWIRGVDAGLVRVHAKPSPSALPAPIRFDMLTEQLSMPARKDLAFHLGALSEPREGGLVFELDGAVPPGAQLPGLPLALAAAAHAAAGKGPIFEPGPAVFHGGLRFRQSSGDVLATGARGTYIAAEAARDAGMPIVVDGAEGFFDARCAEGVQIAPLMTDRIAPVSPPLVVSEGLPSGGGPEGADTAGLPDSVLGPFCEALRAPEGAHGVRLLLLGSRGSPKTMLARRAAAGLCGATTQEEIREMARAFSMSGLSMPTTGNRSFRAPHHSVTPQGLIGGGAGSDAPRPGEVTLAHRGVLYLDDLVEFQRAAIEGLGEAVKAGRVVFSRAASQIVLPSAPRALICGATPPASDGERKRLDRYAECLGLTVLDLDPLWQ